MSRLEELYDLFATEALCDNPDEMRLLTLDAMIRAEFIEDELREIRRLNEEGMELIEDMLSLFKKKEKDEIWL